MLERCSAGHARDSAKSGGGEARGARARVDLRKRKSGELTIALLPREPPLREVGVHDRSSHPIDGVRGGPLLDGTDSALLTPEEKWELRPRPKRL